MQIAITVPEILSSQRGKGTENHTLKQEKSGLSALNLLTSQKLRQTNPNVPDYALPKPKFRDKTSNELCKAIIKWCQLNDHQAERVSVEGRVIDTRKVITDGIGRRKQIGSVTRIKSSARLGSADVSATIFGRSVKIEIKIGKDVQSTQQANYQSEIEQAGGIYLIVKNFQAFFNWYSAFGKEVDNG